MGSVEGKLLRKSQCKGLDQPNRILTEDGPGHPIKHGNVAEGEGLDRTW